VTTYSGYATAGELEGWGSEADGKLIVSTPASFGLLEVHSVARQYGAPSRVVVYFRTASGNRFDAGGDAASSMQLRIEVPEQVLFYRTDERKLTAEVPASAEACAVLLWEVYGEEPNRFPVPVACAFVQRALALDFGPGRGFEAMRRTKWSSGHRSPPPPRLSS
jgi:hypothetical protein